MASTIRSALARSLLILAFTSSVHGGEVALKETGKSEKGEICPDCKGTKKMTCSVCNGDKKALGPCSRCEATGKIPCRAPGCRSGRKQCTACKGTGTVRVVDHYETKKVGNIVKRVVQVPVYRNDACPPDMNCQSCQGSGSTMCLKCDGKKQSKDNCLNCALSGKVGCTRCGESGFIPSPPPSPPEASDLEITKAIQESLRSSLKMLKDSDDQSQKILQEFEKNAERFEKVDASLKPLGDLSKSEAFSADLLEPKKAFERKKALIGASSRKVKVLVEQSAKHQQDLRGLQMNLEIGEQESRKISRDEVDSHQRFAGEYEKEVASLDWQVHAQDQELTRFEGVIKSMIKARQEEEAGLAAAKKARAEIVKSYSRVQAAIQELALGSQFPEFKSQLSESASRSPKELRIEISYMDDAAKDAEDENNIELDEKYLKKVPGMIEAVFNRCAEVSSIKLGIQVNHISKTGIHRPSQVQKFNFENSTTWKELMAGAYKDNWQKILGLCQPAPPYPREARNLLGTEAVFIILIAALVLSMVIFLVARVQILRR